MNRLLSSLSCSSLSTRSYNSVCSLLSQFLSRSAVLSLPVYPHTFPTCFFSSSSPPRPRPITTMDVEDMETFLAPKATNKGWRGRCMWTFEDGGPALRYGEGVDLLSERSVRVKFQALLSKKDGSYSHSRQHSIGYPIPTPHPPDPSNWPILKVPPPPHTHTPFIPPFLH
jgi:hypothetical protein